ncbi:MAG: hypothetical protein ACKVHE_29345, partial [Planctomycetales bacterium]
MLRATTAATILLTLFILQMPTQAEDKDAARKANFYDPIERKIEGWTIAVDPLLLNEENKEIGDKAMKALANHLQRITYIVPEKQLAQL